MFVYLNLRARFFKTKYAFSIPFPLHGLWISVKTADNKIRSRAKPLIGKLASFLPEDPDKTNPNSAEITTQLTGWSWPVNTARGVGVSASPTILWALAFQCHKRTVQSSDPDAKKREKSWNRSGKNIILDPVLPVFLLWYHEIFVIYKYIFL